MSARGWARVLDDEAEAQHVLLVAEDGSGVVDALVFGTTADDDPSATTAEVSALYARPDSQGRGVGAALLRAAARELAGLGFVTLRIGVLSANLPARRFYEVMGGTEVGRDTFDEEGCLLPVTVYEWSDVTTLMKG